jgi:hypothetical protein
VRAVHHARSQIDRGAEQLGLTLLHVTGAEADADPKAVLAARELALDRQRARHPAARRVEQYEEAVAGGTDQAPAMGRDLVADDPVVLCEHLGGGRVAHARRGVRGRLDVGEHDRGRSVTALWAHLDPRPTLP